MCVKIKFIYTRFETMNAKGYPYIIYILSVTDTVHHLRPLNKQTLSNFFSIFDTDAKFPGNLFKTWNHDRFFCRFTSIKQLLTTPLYCNHLNATREGRHEPSVFRQFQKRAGSRLWRWLVYQALRNGQHGDVTSFFSDLEARSAA
jgi:hypothetical protein